MMTALRLRARVGALAPARRESGGIAPRFNRLVHAADLSVEPGEALRRFSFVAASSCAGAALVFGLPAAAVTVPLVAGAALVWLRRRAAGRLHRIEEALPASVATIADALRSGANIEQALSLAAAEARSPLDVELRTLVRERGLGIRFERSLEGLAARCPVPGVHLFSVALSAAFSSGADLPPVLDCIVEAARDRDRLRRELRASTAQGRLTAAVVGGLPAAFLLVLGTGARRELRLLFGVPLGWGLLAAGGGLEAIGFAWINRMVRR